MFSVKRITYCGICLAIAIVLSQFKVYQLPNGGSITACSGVFISLIGLLFGVYTGVLTGVVYGILKLMLEPHVIHPAQLLLDYLLAFSGLGISGLFRNAKYGLHIGYTIGMTVRFIFATLSGFIFFGMYAPEGIHPMIYSLAYNASYIVPEIIIGIIFISLPPVNNAILNIKKRY